MSASGLTAATPATALLRRRGRADQPVFPPAPKPPDGPPGATEASCERAVTGRRRPACLTESVHLIQWCCVHHLWTCALPVMTAACVEPLPLYRPRDPQASDLWRLLDQHFETFQQVYDERFAAKYGFWRPVVERCGEGLSEVRRPAGVEKGDRSNLPCGKRARWKKGTGPICRNGPEGRCAQIGPVPFFHTNWTCPLLPQAPAGPFPIRNATNWRGSQRNFQILDPLEFLAEFTRPRTGASIPPQGAT